MKIFGFVQTMYKILNNTLQYFLFKTKLEDQLSADLSVLHTIFCELRFIDFHCICFKYA